MYTRYETELKSTVPATVRKGTVFGFYNGTMYLLVYIIYPIAFIVGSLLMQTHTDETLTIRDIVVVSTCYSKYLRKE